MTLAITKDSIDLGIVVRDIDAALGFYRDTLGLPFEAELDMPGGMKMYRLLAGSTVVKLLTLAQAPEASPAPGGIQGATGYRYWTITISNLDEAIEAAKAGGRNVPLGPVEVRPGIRIAMIEDPEGNWVELLETS